MIVNNCSHPWTVIDVLVDVCDGSVTSIVVKGLFIGEGIDVLMNVLTVTIVDEGMIILFVEAMNDSGFVVSVSYSVDALAGGWAGLFMKSIGARIEVVFETLAEVTVICVVSGTVVDVLADVDANALSVNTTALWFIVVSI